jgi:eukaryotic-like serine/threonine-protein kinase
VIPTLSPGDRLDRFRIERLVTRGGMASVFRAIDLTSGETVAIKVPHPELESDPLFYDRFHREADIGRKLNHPGVVKILPDEDQSRVYMAMEWIEGRPLREILDGEKKLPIDRAVYIAAATCDALGYIHANGVVHRDLKPDNIMVDAQDRIKLIDFGIAREAGARRLTFARLTKAMGTPDYVSPEQVKNKRGDARCDLYAAGVILFEMLTGELPFQGPNPITAMNQRLLADPIPPRSLNPEISPQLEEILHRALERNPDHRYQTPRDFAYDLLHQSEIGVEERATARAFLRAQPPPMKWSWSYLALAMIPVVLFGLLLFVAHQK